MNRLLIYLGRFMLDMVGYAVAVLVASLSLHILSLPQLGVRAVDEGSVTAAVMLFSVPFIALFIGYFAFLPSLVAIAIAEFLAIRGWLYHALAGGAVGLILTLFYGSSVDVDFLETGPGFEVLPPDQSIFNPAFVTMMVGAGMFAGLAYWAIAGRSSGLWLERAAEPK